MPATTVQECWRCRRVAVMSIAVWNTIRLHSSEFHLSDFSCAFASPKTLCIVKSRSYLVLDEGHAYRERAGRGRLGGSWPDASARGVDGSGRCWDLWLEICSRMLMRIRARLKMAHGISTIRLLRVICASSGCGPPRQQSSGRPCGPGETVMVLI